MAVEVDGDHSTALSRWMLVEQSAARLTIALAGQYAAGSCGYPKAGIHPTGGKARSAGAAAIVGFFTSMHVGLLARLRTGCCSISALG